MPTGRVRQIPRRTRTIQRCAATTRTMPPTPPRSDAAPVRATTSVWRHPGFLRFWLVRVLLTSGFQMLGVAVGWQMYAITGSAFDLGLVGLFQFLPRLALVLHAGAVADRFDRKAVLATSLALQVCIAVALLAGVQGWGLHTGRNLLLALSLGLGVCRAFDTPAVQALLPNVVPPPLLGAAIAAASSSTQVATIVAPAVGGALYAAHAALTYGLDALVYGAAFVLALRLKIAPQQRTAGGRSMSLETLLSGVRFIRSRADMLGAISLDLFAVLLGGATALLPIYARDILLTGPWGLGVLRAAPAAGALVMSLWLMRHPVQRHAGGVMFGAVLVFGAATIVFGLSTDFVLSVSALVVLGAADLVSVVIRGTLVQLETPDDLRGRVNAVNAVFIGASNQLGEFESGVTAAWLGTVPAVVVGGVGTLLVALLWMRWFPALRDRDQLGA